MGQFIIHNKPFCFYFPFFCIDFQFLIIFVISFTNDDDDN